MTVRKSGLGKSLNALLGGGQSVTATKEDVKSSGDSLRQMPVEFLQPGVYQPRRVMDDTALAELSESIRTQGIIQPIVIRAVANNRYEILAGERRWRAAQLAGLAEVPVIVRTISDEAAMAVALIENIQREDLNPLEQAVALQRLQDEFKLTHEDIAHAVGKSRTTVTNLLRLLNLRIEVRDLIDSGDLEMGHARALLSLTGHQQVEAARTVVAKQLTVRDTEALVRALLSPKTSAKPVQKIDPNIASSEREIGERLGAHVKIMHQPKGSGRLVISYNSVDELEGILAHIR